MGVKTEKVGDNAKISQDEWSFRSKRGRERDDPKDTYSPKVKPAKKDTTRLG